MESDEEDEEKMTQLVIAKRMFPATEVSRTFDEYGETIDPRQYMDDEQLELEAEVQKKADIAAKALEKRKGVAIGARTAVRGLGK